MIDDILQDQDMQATVCHINSRTKPLFKEMLNQVGSPIKIGVNELKYGDALFKLDENQFESLFNRWVTKCCEKQIMKKTLSSDCTKKLEWSQELSEVERAFKGMEVLKEII